MKQVTFFPLSPYGFKYVGSLLALAGLLLSILLNPNFQIVLYAGLLVMAFSRERNESDHIASVRAEVFKSVFGFTLSLTIALHLTAWLSEGFNAELPPSYYIGFPLFLYLILFYGSLLLKITPNSSGDFVENMERHPRIYIPWMVLVIVILAILLWRILNVF